MGLAPPDLRPGTVLGGEFVIERPLSAGGMGSVFVARQASTNRARAVKVMSAELVADPKFHDGFLREARVGSLIPSEHVVEVVAAGVDPALGLPWIAMELLEGTELGKHVEQHGPLPWPHARKVLTELFHALSAAHGAGIVHRDLKPANVFLHRSRRAGGDFVTKVLDFGIAKILSSRSGASASMTRSIGTPGWMAPEQVKGAGVNAATDVWALGLVAFFVFAGRSFWLREDDPSGNVHALMYEMLFEPMPTASARAAQRGAAHLLPPGFDAWFARCLQRETGERYPNATLAWQGLEPVLASMAGEPHAPAVPRGRVAPQPTEPMPPRPAPVATREPTVPLSRPPAAMAASAPVRGTTSGATWSSGARSSRKRAAVVAAVAVLGAAGLLGGVAALASLFGGATSSSNAGATAAPGVVSSPAASRSAAAPTPAGVGVELAAGTIEVAGIPVSVGALEADRFEATVADWDECAAAGKCRGSVDDVSLPGLEPREAAFWTSFCTHADRNQRKRHPLNCVSASQARDYCTWRGRRLPTLPEWGYVAYGAGSAAPRRYPWGGAEPTGKHLNACGLECVAHVRPPGASAQPPFLPGFDDGARDTAAAGSYPAGNTPSGVSDMAGNVWEWTATEASDAKGQVTIAGGGWYDRDPARMTLAGTRSLAAEARHASVGFRCVR